MATGGDWLFNVFDCSTRHLFSNQRSLAMGARTEMVLRGSRPASHPSKSRRVVQLIGSYLHNCADNVNAFLYAINSPSNTYKYIHKLRTLECADTLLDPVALASTYKRLSPGPAPGPVPRQKMICHALPSGQITRLTD